MRIYVRLLGIAFLCAPVTLGAQTLAGSARASIPADSAAILAARSTFKWVEAALKAKRLAQQDTTVECENMPLPSDIHLFRDSSAVVRYLMWEGGSEHQFVRTGYYYDENRKLRFAFREQNTEYGTRFEERVYYGNDGQVVRRLRTTVRGSYYGSPEVEPAHDPMEWIRRFCEN